MKKTPRNWTLANTGCNRTQDVNCPNILREYDLRPLPSLRPRVLVWHCTVFPNDRTTAKFSPIWNGMLTLFICKWDQSRKRYRLDVARKKINKAHIFDEMSRNSSITPESCIRVLKVARLARISVVKRGWEPNIIQVFETLVNSQQLSSKIWKRSKLMRMFLCSLSPDFQSQGKR